MALSEKKWTPISGCSSRETPMVILFRGQKLFRESHLGAFCLATSCNYTGGITTRNQCLGEALRLRLAGEVSTTTPPKSGLPLSICKTQKFDNLKMNWNHLRDGLTCFTMF